MATPVKLNFSAPRRGLPPKHFADLTAEQVEEAVVELGLPKFRAKQLYNQYYGRLEGDPLEMTDLPEASRQAVKEKLFPALMTPLRKLDADDGETRKTLWRLHDGTLLESEIGRAHV